MLLDLSKSLNYSVHFIMAIMSTNFAFFLLEQTNNGAEILSVLDDIVEVEDTVLYVTTTVCSLCYA